ncbi:conjugal transfer protein TraR (plasmid) [Cupriavidus sp. USMAHM13]|uniref:TraR/DksA family transcriptional regulator n=1 Tax=Cupriavidus sp. USMAHM13 TaxID=1389192 RepID=UPI0008A6D500|nr:TraR/DksA family transcriptional regulator [Cupriavidus sp. USMAHM13]AOZ04385.1 conjugal transfer protein TraR [Cupriavidus sp. USMAHM13]
MYGLTLQEMTQLSTLLDAEERRIHAVVGSANTPLVGPVQREAQDEADQADEEIAQRVDDAVLNHYRMELADIAAARTRMSRGKYGTCVDCGQAIDFARLQAYPTAKRCTGCQRRHEHLFAREAPDGPQAAIGAGTSKTGVPK